MPRTKVQSTQGESEVKVNEAKANDSNALEPKPVDENVQSLIKALQNQEVMKAFKSMLEPTIQKIVTDSVSQALAPIMTRIDNIEKSVEQISSKIDAIENNVDQSTSRLDKLHQTTSKLQQRIRQLDRASKQMNLLLHGFPIKTVEGESVQQCLTASVLDVFKQADIQDITKDDIDSIIRITPAGQSQFLLMRMKSPKAKSRLYSQRTKLKQLSYRAYINEDLTTEEATNHKKARSRVKEGLLHSCWTIDGLVFGKATADGKPFQIKDI